MNYDQFCCAVGNAACLSADRLQHMDAHFDNCDAPKYGITMLGVAQGALACVVHGNYQRAVKGLELLINDDGRKVYDVVLGIMEASREAAIAWRAENDPGNTTEAGLMQCSVCCQVAAYCCGLANDLRTACLTGMELAEVHTALSVPRDKLDLTHVSPEFLIIRTMQTVMWQASFAAEVVALQPPAKSIVARDELQKVATETREAAIVLARRKMASMK